VRKLVRHKALRALYLILRKVATESGHTEVEPAEEAAS